jgi:hypothetical protein
VKAQCNYCHKKLAGASTSGTNHLRRHSVRCLAGSGANTPATQGLLGFTSSAQTTSNQVWTFSQDITQENLAKMIILHEYPFAIVEHKGFIEFMQIAQPKFIMPGRKTIRSDCVKMLQNMKINQIATLARASHIALTTNLWTAFDLTGYMVVTAHYTNAKWELIKLIISC